MSTDGGRKDQDLNRQMDEGRAGNSQDKGNPIQEGIWLWKAQFAFAVLALLFLGALLAGLPTSSALRVTPNTPANTKEARGPIAGIVENPRKSRDDGVVLVEGYASQSGTAAYNPGRSEGRVETVIRYLREDTGISNLRFRRIAGGESYDEKTLSEEDTCRQKGVVCASRAADSFEPGPSNNCSDQHNPNRDCAVPSETEQTRTPVNHYLLLLMLRILDVWISSREQAQTPATDSEGGDPNFSCPKTRLEDADHPFEKMFMTFSRSLCIMFPASCSSDLRACYSENNGEPDQTDG